MQATPIGRLTKKIQRQPSHVVSAPPTSGPIATAADRRAPDPEGRAALLAVELLREDRERDGEHDRPADALDAAGEVEEERGGGCAAERRGDREERDADEEDPLSAEQVAQRAGVQHRRREHQGIGVDHPLEVGEGGVELLLDIGSATLTTVMSSRSMKMATQTMIRARHLRSMAGTYPEPRAWAREGEC